MNKFRIAIQPDDYGPSNSSSPLWSLLLREAGHEVREVDVRRADILEQLRGCHGFMWRHGQYPNDRQVARRLLPVVERYLGLVVYPDQNTCWHYDDKVAQAYLLEAAGVPIPKTWVWYDADLAKEWARAAPYPLVLKLWSGAGSENVRLVSTSEEAERWVNLVFGDGVHSLNDEPAPRWPPGRTRLRASARLLLKGVRPDPLPPPESCWELHKNYVLFQEFLSGNAFDTRVTVIGDRAFGFRRYNRDDDFRASGSGRIDHDPAGVAPEFVRLAFDVARKLGAQSCAIDGLRRGADPVVGEISYTYASYAVHGCPGHWDAGLNWHEGQLWPEQAQVADFLQRLRRPGAGAADKTKTQ